VKSSGVIARGIWKGGRRPLPKEMIDQ